DDHALGAAQGTDMLDRLVEHVAVRVGALRREIPTGMRTGMAHVPRFALGYGEGREIDDRTVPIGLFDLLWRQIEALGQHRLVGHCIGDAARRGLPLAGFLMDATRRWPLLVCAV